MAANVDDKGQGRIASKEMDNQHSGRGKKGFVHKFGTKGTGMDGNGTKSGGINRPTNSHPQS